MKKEIAETTIKLRRSTMKRLKDIGNMGDTYDTLITRLLDQVEKKSDKKW